MIRTFMCGDRLAQKTAPGSPSLHFHSSAEPGQTTSGARGQSQGRPFWEAVRPSIAAQAAVWGFCSPLEIPLSSPMEASLIAAAHRGGPCPGAHSTACLCPPQHLAV